MIELNQRCVVQYVSVYAPPSSTMEVSRLLLYLPAWQAPIHQEFPMKILLATVALATLVSSSAHAQSGNWRGYYGAYAQVPPPYYRSYGAYGSYDLYGYRSPYPYSAYNDRGQYIRSDPDPSVRYPPRRAPT